jgi:predicted nuclease of predicted toxin-antitoxin system
VKFKLDENLPIELVTDLRGLGHDADTVTDEGFRGAADPSVVDAAFAADRILFTLTLLRQASQPPRCAPVTAHDQWWYLGWLRIVL